MRSRRDGTCSPRCSAHRCTTPPVAGSVGSVTWWWTWPTSIDRPPVTQVADRRRRRWSPRRSLPGPDPTCRWRTCPRARPPTPMSGSVPGHGRVAAEEGRARRARRRRRSRRGAPGSVTSSSRSGRADASVVGLDLSPSGMAAPPRPSDHGGRGAHSGAARPRAPDLAPRTRGPAGCPRLDPCSRSRPTGWPRCSPGSPWRTHATSCRRPIAGCAMTPYDCCTLTYAPG